MKSDFFKSAKNHAEKKSRDSVLKRRIEEDQKQSICLAFKSSNKTTRKASISMEMELKVTTLSDLKKEIGSILKNEDASDFPAVIKYARGFEYKTFKITIEECEEDFFIDSKGEKWMKVKDKP